MVKFMCETTSVDNCPVDRTMYLLNKKWNIPIIRDLFFGKKRFKEFKEDKPELSNKVLSQCLKNLEENDLIMKKTFAEYSNCSEYYLTEKGKALNKIIYELAAYTLDVYYIDEYEDEKVRKNFKNEYKSNLDL
jgi:DNA-binding HxlR family transcriptional regulator